MNDNRSDTDPRSELTETRSRAPAGAAPGWERGVLEKLALEGIAERRRSRRWSIFFRFATLAWLAAMLLVAAGWIGRDAMTSGPVRHTALIDMEGVIAARGENSADKIAGALRDAFEDKRTVGVVLRINSPGGSPVQSGIIYDEIRRLRAIHTETPLYVVVDEICASGGYYVASAADRIFVDKASLVGSIGVLINGFGFVDTLEKLGVQRRLITAGSDKAFLDPFSPLSPKHEERARVMVGEIHQQFIDAVRKGRGDKLKDHPDLFTGMVWSGARSIELGLADAMGTVDSVARDVIKEETVVDFSPRESFGDRFARRLGVGAAEVLGRLAFTSGASGLSLR